MTKPTKTAKLLTYPVVKDGSMVLIGKRHYLEMISHYQYADLSEYLPPYEWDKEGLHEGQPVHYEPEHGFVINVDGKFIEA